MSRYRYANYTIYELYVNKEKRYKNIVLVAQKKNIKSLLLNWKFRIWRNNLKGMFPIRWIIRTPIFFTERSNFTFIIGLPFIYLLFNF